MLRERGEDLRIFQRTASGCDEEAKLVLRLVFDTARSDDLRQAAGRFLDLHRAHAVALVFDHEITACLEMQEALRIHRAVVACYEQT